MTELFNKVSYNENPAGINLTGLFMYRFKLCSVLTAAKE